MNCSHLVVTFGCESCILRERAATLAAAEKEMTAPSCPECAGPMECYERSSKTMTLDYGCKAGFTQDGEFICEGEVTVKVR